MTLLAQARKAEKRAMEIEGDSDSPLRVAAADRWWDKAERLRERHAAARTALRTRSTQEGDKG